MKTLLFLSFLLLSSFTFAQSEKINCIIFIDGKLPQDNQIFDSYISFNDTNNIETIIDFDYVIGDIIIAEKNFIAISLINPLENITIHFSYKSFDGITFSYSGKIKSVLLKYRYFILRITNLNKRKKKYYFGYSSPGGSNSFIKKEYLMFEEPN